MWIEPGITKEGRLGVHHAPTDISVAGLACPGIHFKIAPAFTGHCLVLSEDFIINSPSVSQWSIVTQKTKFLIQNLHQNFLEPLQTLLPGSVCSKCWRPQHRERWGKCPQWSWPPAPVWHGRYLSWPSTPRHSSRYCRVQRRRWRRSLCDKIYKWLITFITGEHSIQKSNCICSIVKHFYGLYSG